MASDNGQFFSTYAPLAKQASGATGFLPSVILAQWADETGYGSSLSTARYLWNFAGISPGGSLAKFPTEQAGLTAYIQTANQHTYDNVRQAKGYAAQCYQLGKGSGNGTTGPYWAAGGYDAVDYTKGVPRGQLTFGIDLVNIIQANNLTKYDPAGSTPQGTPNTTHGGLQRGTTGEKTGTRSTVGSLGATITAPAAGMASSIATDSILINGTTMAANVSAAVRGLEIEYNATGASVLTLSLSDPTASLINTPIFSQKSVLNLTGSLWVLVAVGLQGNILKATFEPWVVQGLRKATGSLTASTGTMTRTAFAALLVSQIEGATFVSAPTSYLSQLRQGYAQPAKEALSRGTIKNPLEDSWACLQRLASEIQWRCFEYDNAVYFVPDSWLASLPPAVTIQRRTDGVETIDGTFDIGQPVGSVTFTALAGSWVPAPGQSIAIASLGPFSLNNWIVTKMHRKSCFAPEITVTLQTPGPTLREPTKGGTRPAVGPTNSAPGDQQSKAGQTTAASAIAYAKGQIGIPYKYAGESPTTGFDCSGLTQASYQAAGKQIPRTAAAQQAFGPAVPTGAINLKPGDLVFFGPRGGPASHVGILVSATPKGTTAKMIDAPQTGTVVRYDTFTPTVGASFGSDAFLGATRPATHSSKT